jgi:transcriptional regulator with XRE-family HTH domain
MGISRGQLRRIENGEVAVRFFPAWNFCQYTNISPLWLAFGDPEPRDGFVSCANNTVPSESRFLEIMERYGEQYRTLRFITQESWFASGDVFSDRNPLLRAESVQLKRRAIAKKTLAPMPLVKYRLIPEMVTALLTWDKLRDSLRAETESPEAKAEVARLLQVTPAAVSQWRLGASAPTADNALRLLQWVVRRREQKEKSAGSASEAPPARTTRVRKSKHEKPHSDRKKK